jgi:hypothetical protein
MKALVIALTLVAGASLAQADGCHFADAKKLKTHLAKHVTFPTTGKDLKAACKKEWPDEFTKEENDCADSKLKDDAKFKNSAEVMKALGM